MKTVAKHRFLRLLLLAAVPFCLASPFPPTILKVETPAGIRTISKHDLEILVNPAYVTVKNPEDQRVRSYAGFWIEDVLKAARIPPGDVYFICADGYTSSLSKGAIGHHRWLFAFGERGGTWTPLNHKGKLLSPAPWYLVGTTPQSYDELPWPYQVVGIRSYAGW